MFNGIARVKLTFTHGDLFSPLFSLNKGSVFCNVWVCVRACMRVWVVLGVQDCNRTVLVCVCPWCAGI